MLLTRDQANNWYRVTDSDMYLKTVGCISRAITEPAVLDLKLQHSVDDAFELRIVEQVEQHGRDGLGTVLGVEAATTVGEKLRVLAFKLLHFCLEPRNR